MKAAVIIKQDLQKEERSEEINKRENYNENLPKDTEKNTEEPTSEPGFWQDDRGIGVIEIVLILVVLSALVLVFKEQITEIVESAFAKISGDAGSIIK